MFDAANFNSFQWLENKKLEQKHNCGYQIIHHSPHLADLGPSDFLLFPFMKNFLRGRHFDSEDKVIADFKDFFGCQENEFYRAGVDALQRR